MSLSALIRWNLGYLIEQWDRYNAERIPASSSLTPEQIRDGAEKLFRAIATELAEADADPGLEGHRFPTEPTMGRCQGLSDFAKEHANARLAQGFSLSDMASEYRAARDNVMRLCTESGASVGVSYNEVMHFHRLIDEALAVAIGWFDFRLTQTQHIFLGMLGQDLRTPLDSIAMLTQVQLRDTTQSAASAEVSTEIHAASQRLGVLLDDLMDFTRTRLGQSLARRGSGNATEAPHTRTSI